MPEQQDFIPLPHKQEKWPPTSNFFLTTGQQAEVIMLPLFHESRLPSNFKQVVEDDSYDVLIMEGMTPENIPLFLQGCYFASQFEEATSPEMKLLTRVSTGEIPKLLYPDFSFRFSLHRTHWDKDYEILSRIVAGDQMKKVGQKEEAVLVAAIIGRLISRKGRKITRREFLKLSLATTLAATVPKIFHILTTGRLRETATLADLKTTDRAETIYGDAISQNLSPEILEKLRRTYSEAFIETIATYFTFVLGVRTITWVLKLKGAPPELWNKIKKPKEGSIIRMAFDMGGGHAPFVELCNETPEELLAYLHDCLRELGDGNAEEGKRFLENSIDDAKNLTHLTLVSQSSRGNDGPQWEVNEFCVPILEEFWK